MPRFVLIHQGQRIVLGDGETMVGRGLSCRIRFNDPAVSRAHLRFYVSGERMAVANMSGSNGTLLNGARLIEPRQVHPGDELRLGYRHIQINQATPEEEALADQAPPEATDGAAADQAGPGGDAPAPGARSPGPAAPRSRAATGQAGSLLIDEEALAEENTRPGEEGWRQRRIAPGPHDDAPAPAPTTESPPATESPLADALRRAAPLPVGPPAGHEPPAPEMSPRASTQPIAPIELTSFDAITVHVCPRCRSQIDFADSTCPSCGYAWPPGHPSSVTQQIVMEQIRARKEPRYAVEVPVIYASAMLTIDAIVRDISRGGMFIATELLDPVGTPCELTALPDGHPAMHFSGVVAHVTTDGSRASGLGIRFVGGSAEALAWLDLTLSRYGDAIVE